MNAFVLAGGQSSRMGRDKTVLELNRRPLIELALGKLRAVGLSPRIVGSRSDLSRFASIVPDRQPDLGPLGGIEAALAVSDTEQNFFLPVDMPWLPPEFLRWMIERVGQTNALATIPRLLGRPQPLCSVYQKALLPHAQAALAQGDAKVTHAAERASRAMGLPVDSFDVESIAAAQCWNQSIPIHRWFDNINTPADFEKAVLEQSAGIH